MSRKVYKKRKKQRSTPKINFLAINSNFDKTTIALVLSLTLFGLIMVYSSSFIVVESKPFYYFIRQALFIILGLGGAFIAYIVDYKTYPKFILPALIFSIVLLIIVLIPGIGKEINGSRRWIDLKFFDLQPSEIIKLTFIIYLAAWSSNQKQKHNLNKESIKEHFRQQLLPFITILGLICSLVLFEPDLATTGIIGLTSLAVYFLSGRDSIHTVGTMIILLVLVISGVFAGLLAPYRFKRIKTYTDFLTSGEVQDPRGTGYQLQNLLIAVGSGGVTGVGFGESRQKFHYLGQTAFSDNIFAVIAEEFGLIGSVVLTTTFFYFLVRGLYIAEKVPDRFGRLLSSGIVIWITLQAFLHIGANIGMIPVTGIPLPFVSYGGSSIVTVLTASGILLNISRSAKLS